VLAICAGRDKLGGRPLSWIRGLPDGDDGTDKR